MTTYKALAVMFALPSDPEQSDGDTFFWDCD